MKTIKIALVCLLIATNAGAQENEGSEKKNIVKLNLFSLPFRTFNVQYERAVGERISVGGTVRFMPKGKLPFLKTFQNLSNDDEADRQLGNAKVGNFGIMPEMRYYVGKKGVFEGFYIGPYLNFSRYNTSLLYEYDDQSTTKTIPLTGDINMFTGGFMIGAQWKLSRAINLDWWILGPSYGISRGEISGKKTLTPSEEQSLRDALEDLDVPLMKFTSDVNPYGATLNFKGPGAAIRVGLCIGISF